MGCANSKGKRCKHCHAPYSPVPRSYSMHIHHPPQSKGDNYHVVALTSTTLGSLKLDSSISNQQIGNANHNDAQNGELNDLAKYGNGNISDSKDKRKDFSVELIEAKTWSNMIEEKIPKVIPRTPVRTPPGEPETINTWELMEGLEDASPFRSPNHFRSFSFDVARDSVHTLKSKLQESESASPKSLLLQMTDESNSKSLISDFDPEVISTFRESFQELPPDHQFYFRPLDNEKEHCDAGKEFSFDTPNAEKIIGEIMDFKCPPYKKDKVVLYFTSLRGVRKTYEHCCHVRVILKSLGVRVDERDVSMHSGFKEELKELLGDGFNGGGLPRVFVGRNYIGGAEEIWRLHEDGKLEKLLCCEKVDDGSGGGGNVSEVCEACGDIRFVPCETCSGSCKIYYEADEEEEEEEEVVEGEEIEYGFQRCPDCNENGLIRCPICCY